jgi:hypothetical protein
VGREDTEQDEETDGVGEPGHDTQDGGDGADATTWWQGSGLEQGAGPLVG